MSERKQTPDVLADILGAGAPAPEAGVPAAAGPEPKQPVVSQVPALRTEPASAARPETAPAFRRREQRPAWEYSVVSCQEQRGWRPRYVNGFEICGWMAGPLIHDYLEQRGQEGWELVGVAAGKPMYSVSDSYQLYFRRARR